MFLVAHGSHVWCVACCPVEHPDILHSNRLGSGSELRVGFGCCGMLLRVCSLGTKWKRSYGQWGLSSRVASSFSAENMQTCPAKSCRIPCMRMHGDGVRMQRASVVWNGRVTIDLIHYVSRREANQRPYAVVRSESRLIHESRHRHIAWIIAIELLANECLAFSRHLTEGEVSQGAFPMTTFTRATTSSTAMHVQEIAYSQQGRSAYHN